MLWGEVWGGCVDAIACDHGGCAWTLVLSSLWRWLPRRRRLLRRLLRQLLRRLLRRLMRRLMRRLLRLARCLAVGAMPGEQLLLELALASLVEAHLLGELLSGGKHRLLLGNRLVQPRLAQLGHQPLMLVRPHAILLALPPPRPPRLRLPPCSLLTLVLEGSLALLLLLLLLHPLIPRVLALKRSAAAFLAPAGRFCAASQTSSALSRLASPPDRDS